MKRPILLLCFSLVVCHFSLGQIVEKRCKTCSVLLRECPHHGHHPERNRHDKTERKVSRMRPRPYVERTETKRPGEEYEIKGNFGSSGLALVKLRGKFGFINREGQEVIPLKYDDVCLGSIGHLTDNGIGWSDDIVLMAVSQNEKWGYVNQKGELVIPIEYDILDKGSINKDDNTIVLSKKGKWGGLGIDGSLHVPFVYDEFGGYYKGHPSYVKQDGKFGFIDEFNNIIAPFHYSSTSGFGYDTIASVSVNDKYGYIDLKGKVVIPLKYDFADEFSSDLAVVVKNGKLGFINKKDELVIDFLYDYDFGQKSKSRFNHGVAAVKRNGKWGIINTKGEIVMPFKYGSIHRGTWASWGSSMIVDNRPVFFDEIGKNVYHTRQGWRDSSVIVLAQQGYAEQQADLAEKYYYGGYLLDGKTNHPKDFDKAFSWFLKAANQNNGKALYFLGWMYEYGQGVGIDYKKAKEYYYKCTKSSSKYYCFKAHFQIGLLAYYGKGCDVNYEEAFFNFIPAAAWGGDGGAMYYLGWMHEYGQGAQKDITTAIEWYEKSKDAGYEAAKKKLQELETIKP